VHKFSNTVHKHHLQPALSRIVMLTELLNIVDTDIGNAQISHVMPTQEPNMVHMACFVHK